jgi:anthranilate phosphoribosyltransferase
MKHVAPVRRELGIRTVFNLLGPLTNPAGAKLQLMGVYERELVEPLAQVLLNLGVKRALVVHAEDGIDEISLCAPTYVCEIAEGSLRTYTVTPEEFGLTRCEKSDLQGGEPAENAAILRGLLSNEGGSKRDAAVLNAGAAMYVSGHSASIGDGIAAAKELIESGAALQKLEDFIRESSS